MNKLQCWELTEINGKAQLVEDPTGPWCLYDDAEKMIKLPTRLTAENGAKAALMGEFSHNVPHPLTSFPDCVQVVDISWTNIKKIYAAAIDFFLEKDE